MMQLSKKLVRWLGALALLSSLAAVPTAVHACTCVDPGTPEERKDKNHAVFDGTVVALKDSSSSLFQSGGKAIKATFEVHEVWKGQVTPELQILTSADEDACGTTLKEGERYLVYAAENNGKLATSACSGTMLQRDAGELIAAYGSGSIPPTAKLGDEQDSKSEAASFSIIWLTGLFIAAAAAILLYVRKNKLKSKI